MGKLTAYSEAIDVQVIKAYLMDSKSHRRIQEEILQMDAPARGGGFEAMKILHAYGIKGDKKGILAKSSIDDEYSKAIGSYRTALMLMKRFK